MNIEKQKAEYEMLKEFCSQHIPTENKHCSKRQFIFVCDNIDHCEDCILNKSSDQGSDCQCKTINNYHGYISINVFKQFMKDHPEYAI